MKKPRKAKVESEIIKKVRYHFTCPHCKTVIVGGFDNTCIRIRCTNCSEEVILDYPKLQLD